MEDIILPTDILYEICKVLDTNTLANFILCNKYFMCNKYLQLVDKKIINVGELHQKDIHKLLVTRYESINKRYGERIIFHNIGDSHKLLLQKTDCAIIVGCEDATERMIVHEWAERRGLRHSACRYEGCYEGVDDVYLYKCSCGTVRYRKDVIAVSGHQYDSGYWVCLECDTYNYYDDEDGDRGRVIDYYNAVIMGYNLPDKVGKRMRRRRNKIKKEIPNVRINFNSISLNVIKVISLSLISKDKLKGVITY
ncbi:Hypothetical protein ORPV_139 [Orpheovirus IHUMI-LCC2]|uniref:F-box domain-containing protein n=1 Tax=Orpheovirus IHUMI-LCC2 TaxID=2023057 RepID=A0A2I2L3E1_9VIRU|nr:Hypothetical protein ORPV_139 [Orpheovirus IHUMI-LCC2]SNW62043.1 Hypothetical protein ORPV_139 [Orpheovirus IHUMI-LCC2]